MKIGTHTLEIRKFENFLKNTVKSMESNTVVENEAKSRSILKTETATYEGTRMCTLL